MKMNNDIVLDIFNNLHEHVVYDKGLKEICYSAQLVKATEYIRNKIKEGKISE